MTSAISVADQRASVPYTNAMRQIQETVMTDVERVGFCVLCRTVGRREKANTTCIVMITQSCHMEQDYTLLLRGMIRYSHERVRPQKNREKVEKGVGEKGPVYDER